MVQFKVVLLAMLYLLKFNNSLSNIVECPLQKSEKLFYFNTPLFCACSITESMIVSVFDHSSFKSPPL